EEFDFYAIACASNDFSIKRFLIAFLKMTFLFLFLSVLRLKSRNKDQPGDVKNGAWVLLRITFCRFAMGGLFSTNVQSENCTSFNHKCVIEARHPAYCKCAVSSSFSIFVQRS